MMRFRHLEVFGRDPLASIDFYRDALGFDVEEIQGTVVWLTSGSLSLLLRPGDGEARHESYQRASMAIVLYAEDVAAARARLERHGVTMRGDDGPGCLTFTDPDGHWFQLVDQE